MNLRLQILSSIILSASLFFQVTGCKNSDSQMEKDKNQTEADHLFTLSENSVQKVSLPFAQKDIIPELTEAFHPKLVTKELGQFEYGTAPIYQVKEDDKTIILFEMDMEDTLKLNNAYFRKDTKDQYGLKIGDKVSKIQELRGKEIEHYMDFHQKTYVIVPNSNIMYQVYGNFPKGMDLSNPSVKFDEIQDWEIEEIIWREYPDDN